MPSTRNLAILAFALILLAACGGAATPAKLVDGCALLTKADVESLFGQPVAAPEHKEIGEAPKDAASNAYVSTCNYHTEGDPMRQASILARQSFAADEALATLKSTQEEMKNAGNEVQPVSGLGDGDGAYWDASFKQLNFVKGAVWYIVSADASDSASALENAQTLAAAILGRQ
ncbi:MAG: hypothetical protein IPK16_25020 [Anaerolineales bacterium]|nr:hypothetical protein [Anaerolineales bacterium]